MTNLEKLISEIREAAAKAYPTPWDNRVETGSLDNHARPRFIWSEYGFMGEFSYDYATENAIFTVLAVNSIEKLAQACEVMREALQFYVEVIPEPAEIIVENMEDEKFKTIGDAVLFQLYKTSRKALEQVEKILGGE